VLYLDSSAIVKLVLQEPETPALRGWLGEQPFGVTSALAQVEVRRTVRIFAETVLAGRREGTAEELRSRTDSVISGIVVIALDDAVLSRAASLDPTRMRTLDAIHLASALSLEDLDVFVTYDHELAQAAREAGLAVAAPGVT
jgi:predicted nucleic acid-binding protein